MHRSLLTAAAPPALKEQALRPRAPVPRLAWLLVGTWLLGTTVAFWYFGARLERPFEVVAIADFAPEQRAREAESWFRQTRLQQGSALGSTAAATVVHVYRAGCACNRFTEPHLADIETRYRPRHVQVLRIEAAQVKASGRLGWLDAMPAALVFDSAGQLIYYGPYSDGARCGTGTGLVERTLDRTLKGSPPKLQRVLSTGCFCGGSELNLKEATT